MAGGGGHRRHRCHCRSFERVAISCLRLLGRHGSDSFVSAGPTDFTFLGLHLPADTDEPEQKRPLIDHHLTALVAVLLTVSLFVGLAPDLAPPLLHCAAYQGKSSPAGPWWPASPGSAWHHTFFAPLCFFTVFLSCSIAPSSAPPPLLTPPAYFKGQWRPETLSPLHR